MCDHHVSHWFHPMHTGTGLQEVLYCKWCLQLWHASLWDLVTGAQATSKITHCRGNSHSCVPSIWMNMLCPPLIASNKNAFNSSMAYASLVPVLSCAWEPGNKARCMPVWWSISYLQGYTCYTALYRCPRKYRQDTASLHLQVAPGKSTSWWSSVGQSVNIHWHALLIFLIVMH